MLFDTRGAIWPVESDKEAVESDKEAVDSAGVEGCLEAGATDAMESAGADACRAAGISEAVYSNRACAGGGIALAGSRRCWVQWVV